MFSIITWIAFTAVVPCGTGAGGSRREEIRKTRSIPSLPETARAPVDGTKTAEATCTPGKKLVCCLRGTIFGFCLFSSGQGATAPGDGLSNYPSRWTRRMWSRSPRSHMD